MAQETIRIDFDRRSVLKEAELTLHLAMVALEGLLGQARVRLEARYTVDEGRRSIVISVDNHTGVTLARVFVGLLIREFGEEAFTVIRPPIAIPQRKNPPAPDTSGRAAQPSV